MGESGRDKTGKKIGVIGLGSIGLRHVGCLYELGIRSFVAYRTGKGTRDIPMALSSVIISTNNLKDLKTVDAILIANPTSLHVETIEKILPFNKPMFIEKPLADNLENLERVIEALKNHPEKVQIGFCLRYHQLFQEVRNIISSGVLGEIYQSRLEVGQYLPSWHPYTDYRTEYFSRTELGGGAIRTLSHEIDLVNYFFGEPTAIKAFVGKVSNLEINTDDYALLLLRYKQQTIKVEIDFLQKKPKRKGVIFGKIYDLEYDLFENYIRLYDSNGKLQKEIRPTGKDMYTSQMEDFLSNKSNGDFSTISQSYSQMKIIRAAEEYTKQNKWKLL